MPNPAELLHENLTQWRARKGHNADPTEQRIAVRHLDAIAELLNRLDDLGERTDLYRPHFDHWAKLTLNNPHAWQKQPAALYKDDAALQSLQYLGDKLDGLLPRLENGGLAALREYVDGVRSLLDEDDSISDPVLIGHVKQVLAHVEWCINNFDAVGEFDLQEAIYRLVASMLRATAASEKKDRWRDKLNTVAWPFAADVVAAIAAAPAQIAIAAALGG